MTQFSVRLFREEREALVALAQEERRDPRDQAALIIRQELERRGMLPQQGQGQEVRDAPQS